MKKQIAILGGGPSAFLLAAFLDAKKFKITIYEKNKTVGRKFLVAGKGGFNLTHSEPTEQLIKRYTSNDFLDKALLHFTNTDFRNWLDQIGIPTYVGSSKRVYPKEGIKPIEVLSAILKHLKEKGVIIKYEHTFSDWDNHNNPIINNISLQTDYTIFSLGGGSWKVTGSDGSWLDTFSKKGIKTKPFQASNCGYKIDWSPNFIEKNEGIPLKNIAISCSAIIQKGEAVITRFGLEGNAIYPLIWKVRESFSKGDTPKISIDFKPLNPREQLLDKIKNKAQRTKTFALSLNLNSTQIALIKSFSDKKYFLEPSVFITNVKQLQIPIHSLRPMEEAISTVGGIDINEVNANFSLKKNPSIFVIGEMLDWDAPTGGFLLQGCFSMAHAIEIK